jgi:hypothetical protein
MRKYAEDNLKVEEKMFDTDTDKKLSAQARIIRDLSSELSELRKQLRRYRNWNKDRAKFLTDAVSDQGWGA